LRLVYVLRWIFFSFGFRSLLVQFSWLTPHTRSHVTFARVYTLLHPVVCCSTFTPFVVVTLRLRCYVVVTFALLPTLLFEFCLRLLRCYVTLRYALFVWLVATVPTRAHTTHGLHMVCGFPRTPPHVYGSTHFYPTPHTLLLHIPHTAHFYTHWFGLGWVLHISSLRTLPTPPHRAARCAHRRGHARFGLVCLLHTAAFTLRSFVRAHVRFTHALPLLAVYTPCAYTHTATLHTHTHPTPHTVYTLHTPHTHLHTHTLGLVGRLVWFWFTLHFGFWLVCVWFGFVPVHTFGCHAFRLRFRILRLHIYLVLPHVWFTFTAVWIPTGYGWFFFWVGCLHTPHGLVGWFPHAHTLGLPVPRLFDLVWFVL